MRTCINTSEYPESNYYRTTDFQEIVWLLSKGNRVVSTSRLGPKQVEFEFPDLLECQTLIHELRHGLDTVSFSEIFQGIHTARALIRKT